MKPRSPHRLPERRRRIPIKGGNVENVVYDATALRMWVSYAKGKEEAYLRPYVYVDLKTIDAYFDALPEAEKNQFKLFVRMSNLSVD